MTPPVLLPDELAALTERVRPSAQARELDRMGIPHLKRSNGTLVVWRDWNKPKEEQEAEDWEFTRTNDWRHPVYEGKRAKGWWNDNKDRLCMTLEQLLPLRNRDKTDAPNGEGVYVLFYQDEIVYVGQTRNFQGRIWSHIRTNVIPFDSIVTISCPELCLTKLETYYYETFSPPFNYRYPQSC